jgi:hypothetical protein
VLEEALADGLATGGVGRREELQQPGERVLDVPAREVEVGDEQLRVHVVGGRGGRGADLVGGLPVEAVQEAHLREPGDREGVARVLRDRRAVLGGGCRVVALLDERVRLRVVRRQRLLDRGRGLLGSGGRDGPAGHAVLLRQLQHLLDDVAHLVLGDGAREEADRTTADERRDGRHGLRLERLAELRALVDVDAHEEHAARVLRDHALEHGRQLAAGGEARGDELHEDRHDAGDVEELRERRVVGLEDEAGHVHRLRRAGRAGGRSRGTGGRGRGRSGGSGSRRLRAVHERGQVDGAAEARGGGGHVRHGSSLAEVMWVLDA